MGKFKDRFNKLMRPHTSKPKESEDARAPVTAAKSLTDSAEQEPASLSKAYRSALLFASTAGKQAFMHACTQFH